VGSSDPHAGANNNASSFRVLAFFRQSSIGQGHFSSSYCQLRAASHPASFFDIHVIAWIKTFDLSGNLAGHIFWIKLGDFGYA
jgi:hypothetical protein